MPKFLKERIILPNFIRILLKIRKRSDRIYMDVKYSGAFLSTPQTAHILTER